MTQINGKILTKIIMNEIREVMRNVKGDIGISIVNNLNNGYLFVYIRRK